MADWKEMYLSLMRDTERAIRILTEAQRRCEELYLREDGPPLSLLPIVSEPPTDGTEVLSERREFPNFQEKGVDKLEHP